MNKFKKVTSWFLSIVLLVAVGYGFFLLHDHGLDLWFVVFIAIYLLNALFALAIFSQRRHSGAKLSWFIVFLVLPFFGHAIFILFGRRYKQRKRHEVYIKDPSFSHEILGPNPKITDRTSEIFDKQSVMSNRGIYDGDVKIYDNGIDAFREMFKTMRSAKKFISIDFYIIHPGEIYEEFKSILIQKAHEGVEVRFIVDDFGRWAMPWYEINQLEKEGIKIEIFGKVTFPFIGSQNGYRTHRKMVIVDGESVFTGGMNIGDEYANLDKKYGNWVDYQIKITGAAVRSYTLLFIRDWNFVSGEGLKFKPYLNEAKTGKSQLVLVEDGPNVIENIIQSSIINWILHAKYSIEIATPYFIPTDTILEALKTASMSGVKVTIYIPGKADKKSVLVASKYWAQELVSDGVQFREVNNMLIHSKIGIFDKQYAYVGSANIDMRSIYSQFETLTLMHGPAVKSVSKIFSKYKKMSRRLSKDDLKLGRVWNRFLRIVVSIFSPMM